MKIYEIGTGYTPIPAQMGAATEIVVEELTKAFLKLGQQVEILDIASGDRAETDLPIQEVPVPRCFRGTDVKLGIMHKLKRVVYSVCLAISLQKILKDTKEKVILHFHNQYNLFFFLKLTPRKLRSKALIAYTNHSGIWRQEWSKIEKIIRKRYFQEAECMRKADILFLLNSETRENVIRYLNIPEEQIVLVDNGVNTDIYQPISAEEKLEAKKKWNLEGCQVILQVGSVNENKGQLRTAEYLLPLMKKHPNLVFAYAGGIVDKEYQKKICTFSRIHGLETQIRYLGMQSPGKNLNELYNCARFLICSSRYEGASLAIREGLAAGASVLVEKGTTFYAGEGCLFYEPGDSGEWLALEDSLSDQNRCREARSNAVSHYSWDKVASDYDAEFKNRMK